MGNADWEGSGYSYERLIGGIPCCARTVCGLWPQTREPTDVLKLHTHRHKVQVKMGRINRIVGCIDASVLVVLLYYSFAKWKPGKMHRDYSILLQMM